MKHFTGKDSSFEAPAPGAPDWTIQTDDQSEAESLDQLLERVLPLVSAS